MNKRRVAALAAIVAGIGLMAAPAAANATGNDNGGGHDPRVVCHNRVHNPHIIVVDANSTKYQGHLKHREQAQLMDLVEGVDGTAAEIRAACVSEVEVTEPPVTVTKTVPGPTSTETVTGPPVTETQTIPGPTTTETVTGPPSTETVTIPGPVTTETVTGPPSTETQTVPGPVTTETVTLPGTTETSTETLPVETRTVQVPGGQVVKSVAGPVSTNYVTAAGTTKTVVRSGKETLAYTGMDIGVTSIGVLLFGAGFFLLVVRSRIRQH